MKLKLEEIIKNGYNIEMHYDNECVVTIHGKMGFKTNHIHKLFKSKSIEESVELAYIFIKSES